MSTTQFVWKNALGMPDLTPEKFGSDDLCWLCGGITEEKGWRINDVIGSAFTDSNIAKQPNSKTVCQSCSALMKKEAWVIACEKFGFDPHFPVKDGKKPFLSNWMFSSHVFSQNGGWQRPDRKGVRDVLLNPPEPPFVITIAAIGKKHVIFRAEKNMSKDAFFVQFDDEKIFVNRDKFKDLIAEFEKAYTLGFSKDSLLTGKYNQAAIMSAGINVWHEIERSISIFRIGQPGLLQICSFCAQKIDA